MTARRRHPYLKTLMQRLVDGKVSRREFLRTSTLLGLSAAAAYGFAGLVLGGRTIGSAEAAMPKGGTLRIGMRVMAVDDPHTFHWIMDSNIGRQVLDYVTVTGHDNITRPSLAESWEPSEDLRTWTFRLRQDVKWHNGRRFTADDVIWNVNRALDPKTGSSIVGLMKGYMLEEYETGEKDADGNPVVSERLWDANAIEKVDDFTFRINAKVPQLAVPEHFFHYPFVMLDPEEGGAFGPGSNGTGAFELIEHEVGKKSVLRARSDYWGEGPYVDMLEFIDLGDDPSAGASALASKQIHGLYEGQISQLSILKNLPHAQIYEAPTAQTAVARMKVTEKPFDDPRVRKAMRLAVDPQKVLDLALRGVGLAGEHHHVCPIHPEYAKLPAPEQNIAEAKRLLAEAGYPDGFDTEIYAEKEPAWEPIAVQAMIEMWKEVGVRVRLNVLPSAQYWDNFMVVPFGFTQWAHRPLGTMTLGLAYRTGVPWNESGYANPEFDRLLTEAEGILDVEKRREVMAKLEAIMQEDGPIVQPAWRSVFTAFDKRVKGFKMHPTSYIFGHQLALEPA